MSAPCLADVLPCKQPGSVSLQTGLPVEQGATFWRYPSSRPACPPPLQLRHRHAEKLHAVGAMRL